MSSSLDEMYREIILDHYRSPRGKRPIDKIDAESDGKNPACGDEIEMQMQIENDILKDIHVGCKGCAISVASGSILAESVKGRPFEEVLRIAELVRKLLKGEEVEIPEEFEDIDALKGVRKFPVRIKCALLAWLTLIDGLKNYRNGSNEPTTVTTEEKQNQ